MCLHDGQFMFLDLVILWCHFSLLRNESVENWDFDDRVDVVQMLDLFAQVTDVEFFYCVHAFSFVCDVQYIHRVFDVSDGSVENTLYIYIYISHNKKKENITSNMFNMEIP